MALRTKIKVGNITNLSEARYCAGMGIDFLGFPIVENEKDLKKFQEISSWVSGTQFVLELQNNGLNPLSLEQLQVDFIQLHFDDLTKIDHEKYQKRLFVLLPENPDSQVIDSLDNKKDSIEYLILSEVGWKTNSHLLSNFKVMIEDNLHEMNWEALLINGASGFSLQGSKETSPGILDYEHLSNILELLDSNQD